MSNVFLSHSHADKKFARRLAFELEAAGHGVWIDEAEIDIGDSLIEKIRDGIDQVDYVAAILSKSSINSEWVTRELDIASNREIEERRVVVLPLLVENVKLPGFLKGKFYGDFTDETQFDKRLSLLLRKLGKTKKLETTADKEIIELKEALKDLQNDDLKKNNNYTKNILILTLERNIAGKTKIDELDDVLGWLEEDIFESHSDKYNQHVLRNIVKESIECRETAYSIVNKHWYALYE